MANSLSFKDVMKMCSKSVGLGTLLRPALVILLLFCRGLLFCIPCRFQVGLSVDVRNEQRARPSEGLANFLPNTKNYDDSELTNFSFFSGLFMSHHNSSSLFNKTVTSDQRQDCDKFIPGTLLPPYGYQNTKLFL